MQKKASIILMHGALGAGSQLTSLQSRLSVHYDVHILEFEGHGAKRHEKSDLTLENLSAQLLHMAGSDPSRRPHVFGYSLGGYVALYTARHHPETLNRIMTLGTKFDWNPRTVSEQFSFLDSEKIKNEIPQLQHGLTQLHGEYWEKLVHQTRRFVEHLGQNPAIDASFCRDIKNKVLILRGDKDRMVCEQESAEMAAHLPQGHFANLHETPHPIDRVDLDKLFQAIHDFLSLDSNGQ